MDIEDIEKKIYSTKVVKIKLSTFLMNNSFGLFLVFLNLILLKYDYVNHQWVWCEVNIIGASFMIASLIIAYRTELLKLQIIELDREIEEEKRKILAALSNNNNNNNNNP